MKPRAERSRYLDLFQVAILPFSYTGSWQVKIEMEESTFVMGGGGQGKIQCEREREMEREKERDRRN